MTSAKFRATKTLRAKRFCFCDPEEMTLPLLHSYRQQTN